MSSRVTGLITLRLQKTTLEKIAERAKKANVSAHEYLRDRVEYDINRKHIKGKEINIE